MTLRSAYSRSQWPRGLRRRSMAARLLRLWVRIPPGAWIFVCCECCVLSGESPLEGCKIQPPMGVVAPGGKKKEPHKGIDGDRDRLINGQPQRNFDL